MSFTFRHTGIVPAAVLSLGTVLLGCPALSARADTDSGGGYRVGEHKSAPPVDRVDDTPGSRRDSQRSARFGYVSGDVTWRPDDGGPWAKANTSTPLSAGSQIWVSGEGRAEIRFDDGSTLRLGRDTTLQIEALNNDDQGPFGRIHISSGLVTLRVKPSRSLYQLTTSAATVDASGPARVRAGVGDTTEVGVRLGRVRVRNKQGNTLVEAGGYVSVADQNSSFSLRGLPPEDSWERWNDDRDRTVYGDVPPVVHRSGSHIQTSIWLYLDIPLGRIFDRHDRDHYDYSRSDRRGGRRY